MEPSAFGKNHCALLALLMQQEPLLHFPVVCAAIRAGINELIQRRMGSLDSSLLMAELTALSSQPL